MATPKGQSGNPKGGKPDKLMRDALRISLLREAEKGSKTKRLQQVADALVDAAIGGDVQAIKEINDRMDGKVTQPLGGDSEAGPIQVSIKRYSDAGD
jgi:hypothetical protein